MKVDPPSSSPLLLLLLQNVTMDYQRGGANLSFSPPVLPPSHPSLSPSSSALSFLPSSSPYSLPPSSSPSLPLPSPPSDLESLLLWTVREPTTVALSIMYSLSFSLGIVGNAMSLRVLTGRRGNSRLAGASATRLLLVNLAVCDLAVVLVCMPVTLGNQIYAQWVYGDFLCRAVPFTQAVSVSASVLTLTVTSINRYVSVRSPLRARTLFTRRRIIAMVAVVWVVSWTICSPLAVLARREEVALGSLVLVVCQEAWPGPRLKQGYNVLLFLALYCLPVSFNLAIGFLTVRRLGGGGHGGPFSELDPRSRALHCARLRARRRIARVVVALVLLFAVSWLPLYLADLWIDRERQRPPSWLLQSRPFAQWLGLTNSSLNPLCYCFLGDIYRSARLLRSRYRQQRLARLCCGPGQGKEEEGCSDDAVAVDTVSVKSRDDADTVVTSRPRMLGGFGGRGAGAEGAGIEECKMADGESSDHSNSDWFSQSLCESSLLASQPEMPLTPSSLSVSGDCGQEGERGGALPLTRRTGAHKEDTSPLRTGNDPLTSRRYSGEHIVPLRPGSGERGTLPLREHYAEKNI
ncbi:galanin receptor type 1-like [Osmerus eperlanus]|uniref:galanin receptor type 1-like n=1 Tax=Osmerus eperlanus TaxID=29151 RepID=UPI002E0E5F64